MSKKDVATDEVVVDKEENSNENDKCPENEAEGTESAEKNELELVKEELNKKTDAFMRLAAEYENFRKRSVKEKDAIYKNATADAVETLLPVLDSLGFALQAIESAPPEYQKGVEMMKSQFETAFEKLGVSAFGEAGEEFDPNIHNAVSHVDDETVADNIIVEVFQTGYAIGEKIIRHAMVKVAN